jgi:TetR/AcrR family transcriptional regulator, transcriptional repressor for nem operon
MRVSKQKAAENCERVVATAARLLRERGYDGVSIGRIMAGAGLTHGGFYSHFASKDNLAVQATGHAATTMGEALQAGLAQCPDQAFRSLISFYLSPEHRRDAGSGCILPALAADAARQDSPELRAIFAAVIQAYLDALARLAPTIPEAFRDRPPIAVLSEMVGAVVLSRVMMDGDMADRLVAEVTDDLVGTRPSDRAQNRE